ncbi:MAG: hypothetical protein H8K08_08050 [Nitrospira sp.]|nr:hypothetical protein [Nitrospira sp.]
MPRIVLVAAVAILYALVALPLPYLLVDHYSAMQSGDPSHSDLDIHAWLEWAAGSSLSEAGLVVPSVPAPSLALPIPPVPVFSVLLDSALLGRGPPAAV